MKWKTILNPFEKYSEKQLLIASVLITILGSLIGSYCQVIYDGFLDVHSYENTFSHVVLENVINGMVMTIFLFALGKIINNKTRFIDALNTAFIARFPIYLVALITNFSVFDRVEKEIERNTGNLEILTFQPVDLALITILSFLMLLLLAYTIILLVNGFKTASYPKKWLHYLLLGIVIILVEWLSKYLIYHF